MIKTIKEKYNSLTEDEKVIACIMLGIFAILAIGFISYYFGVMLGLLYNRMS